MNKDKIIRVITVTPVVTIALKEELRIGILVKC